MSETEALQRMAVAMETAAAEGNGKRARAWAAQFGVGVNAVYRMAAKLKKPSVLLPAEFRAQVEHGRGRRARIGHALLEAAFGEKLQKGNKLRVRVFPPDGGGDGAILITTE